MNAKPGVPILEGETTEAAKARVALTPEYQSAAVMFSCRNLADTPIVALAAELKTQAAALKQGDMSRAEDMLLAQAHALNGLFSNMVSRAMGANQLDTFDSHMRIALKAQNQCRATLQTLGELKSPKQVAFVRQANIGNQVQVNNGTKPARTRKNQKVPNELLEVENGERMDTRAASAASNADPAMETLGTKHRPKQC
uniref:Uncharacterized protein n=1 Tax=viral metagenome TaxID=1070528 RepID=A0A6M3M1G6_9ZZZZ